MANLRADNLTGTGGRNAIDGSVAFLGDKDALQVPAGSDFAYGTGDFTIETWIRPEGLASGEAKGIFTQTQSGNDYVKFFVNSDKTVKATFGSDTITGGMVEVASWSHVAVTRASNTVKVFVNGVASSGTSVTTDFTDTTRKPTIGQYTHSFGTLEYYGYISNFRIVKGTAVYTTDFTPPTEKLTAIDGTVLLCCQDSDNELQEATGKTITGYGNLDTTQTEKINGRFTGDPTGNGWSLHSGASGSYANGQWTVTSPASIWKGAYTSFTSVIGQQYHLTGIVVTSNNWGSISVSNDGGAAKIIYPGWNGSSTFPLTINNIFTATATTTYISIDNLNTTNTTATTVQYLSVKPVEVGKAPKVLPPVGVDEGVVFDGDTKVNSQGYMYFPTGNTAQRANSRGRAVIPGGYNPTNSPAASRSLNTIEYIEINTTANAVDFGDLSYGSTSGGTCSSSTRAVTGGGYVAPSVAYSLNTMSYFTIATTGNGTNFGDLTVKRGYVSSLSSDTRGIWAGGAGGPSSPWIQADVSITDYVTIASEGDATDFGQLIDPGYMGDTACSSPTRGVIAGGNPATNTIQYITIASTGVAKDFGDLSTVTGPPGAASSHTRAIFCGASPSAPAYTALNHIDYVTIATTGNANDFGDALYAGYYKTGTSNCIRAVWVGTYASPAKLNTIEYAQIQTLGNTVDFGDSTMTYANRAGATSDSHGGLS